MSLRTLLTTLLLTCSFSVIAATEIVPLNYRTSADLLPVAQNFLGKDGKVSAYGNQLIVNAEPEKITELRAFLEQLDTAPKRLLITVDTNENNTQDQQGYSVNGARIISRSTASRGGTQRHSRHPLKRQHPGAGYLESLHPRHLHPAGDEPEYDGTPLHVEL